MSHSYTRTQPFYLKKKKKNQKKNMFEIVLFARFERFFLLTSVLFFFLFSFFPFFFSLYFCFCSVLIDHVFDMTRVNSFFFVTSQWANVWIYTLISRLFWFFAIISNIQKNSTIFLCVFQWEISCHHTPKEKKVIKNHMP